MVERGGNGEVGEAVARGVDGDSSQYTGQIDGAGQWAEK